MSDTTAATWTSADEPSGSGGQPDRVAGRLPSAPAASEIDTLLIARMADGDHAALGELHDRFAGRVYSLARGICGDDAENVHEAVFLDLWNAAGGFDPAMGTPASWVLDRTHARAVASRRARIGPRGPRRPAGDGATLPTPPGVEPAVAVEVLTALADLPAAQAQVLLMAYYGGQTLDDVASVIGVAPGAAVLRAADAVAALRTTPGPPER